MADMIDTMSIFTNTTRLLAGSPEDEKHSEGEESHSEFGVHVEYNDIYFSIIFFAAIYISGQIAARFLKMPNLVGEIAAGILLGPPLGDIVPLPEAFVLLGEIGLILLVIEAGIDIDLGTLKLIGARGVIIAFLGSVFPIGIGIAIAFALGVDTKGAIAAGASFGPTSLGIALNILRSGGILNTPVGQLIISAAVIDDMIALVVLSQLRALSGTITVAGVLIPVVSALLFLVVGGYLAICILPGIINKYILVHFSEQYHNKIELTFLFGMLLVLMPATFYAQASFLMGAFVAGLTFCSSHGLHHAFVAQFKRVLQWLIRIFFAASIGFQVPIKEFGSGVVIWKGLVFTIALLGKLGAGFMVPNFSTSKRFHGLHLRDCLITGFSLAAEGEFAFVIAVFAVDAGLIGTELYSSIVLAVLLSTIVPPFLLRFTISRYNKQAEDAVREAAEMEMSRRHDLESHVEITDTMRDDNLREEIKNKTVVFLCIQTQSAGRWGLLTDIMQGMHKLKIEVIDHRSWHPRGVNTTLVNEIYAKDNLEIMKGDAIESLEAHMQKVKERLEDIICQEDAKVRVTRWYPGVVTEIVEEVEEKNKTKTTRRANIEERLLSEATHRLESKRQLQTMATKAKSVKDIVQDLGLPEPSEDNSPVERVSKPRKRRVRQKMRSTPVFGGSLFGEDSGRETTLSSHEETKEEPRLSLTTIDVWSQGASKPKGHSAEIKVDGETFRIRISDEYLKNLQNGGNDWRGRGFVGSGMALDEDSSPVVNMLQGFVRNNAQLQNIQEEQNDDMSEDFAN